MKIDMCKMALRGQAFDALQCSQQVLDEIIRGNAIPGMKDTPLSGIDQAERYSGGWL
jgi:hypothetical protein